MPKYKKIENFGDPNKPERRKYLETLMADMGITSLDELSPEERRRFKDAARPSFLSHKSSQNRFHLIKKISTIVYASEELRQSLQDAKTMMSPDAIAGILKVLSPEALKSSSFDSDNIRDLLEYAVEDAGDDLSYHIWHIESIVESAALYNSEYAKIHYKSISDATSHVAPEIQEDEVIGRGSPNGERVFSIQNKLLELGYPLRRYGADGRFGPETENAVVLFQRTNNLPVVGYVDSITLDKLFGSPIEYTEHADGETDVEFSRIDTGRVNISELSPMAQEYLGLLDSAAETVGASIFITSGFRDSHSQARVMYSNYSSRGVGSTRADNYLMRLYRPFPNIDRVVDVFAGRVSGVDSKEDKINYASSNYISHWPKTGHAAGNSIDVSMRGQSPLDALIETQNFASVDILDEGDHYHVTVRSLEPGGISPGTVRRFRA